MAADTTARTYARALLSAAGSDAGAVRDQLVALVEALRSDAALWQALAAPSLDNEQRKQLLDRTVEGASTAARNFLHLVIDNRRLDDLPAIVDEFEQLVARQQNKLDVEVLTAVELPDNLRSRLEQKLSESTGKQVALTPHTDPTVIGGLVIKHGDTLIDASIRGRLDMLRNELRSAPIPRNDRG